MNWDWKDYIIATTLGIIIILAMFTLVDWTIEKDSTVGVGVALGFIGALLGGLISGGLTLLGVRLTIKEQRRSMSQEKFDKARYILYKIVTLLWNIDSAIVSINGLNSKDRYESIEIKINEFEEIIDKYSKLLLETEFQFISNVELIHEQLIEIKRYLNDPENTITDMEMKKGLLIMNNEIKSKLEKIKQYMGSHS